MLILYQLYHGEMEKTSLNFERTWWRLFQKRVVSTKF